VRNEIPLIETGKGRHDAKQTESLLSGD